MDLRYGVNVPISSIPFHCPVSDKEGKFPLQDIRYYYITNRDINSGLVRTKLFVCHSGFFYSSKRGHCLPSFMHEYVLAGSSYKLGVNLMEQAKMAAVGNGFFGKLGIEMSSKAARMTIGNSALETVEKPQTVYGTPISTDALMFTLGPCVTQGYHPTPDYRFYFTCYNKASSSSEVDKATDTNADDDDDDDWVQIVHVCPPDLYFSDFYGFCVSPYIHQFLGLQRLERYIWGKHKLKHSNVSSEGIQVDETCTPWEIPVCTKPGRHALRDPRYYVFCGKGPRQLFMCPTNTYFSVQYQTCVSVQDCDCWFKIGYFADPFPRNGYGQGIDIFIHLDRGYLVLLRKITGDVVRRSAQAGRGDATASMMIKKLVCFWRDMEKYRTLRYQYTSPKRDQVHHVGPHGHHPVSRMG